MINAIIGDHLSHKEFSVCLDMIKNLLNRDCLGVDAALFSKLGYIQLQIGDLEGAKVSFSRVEGIVSQGNAVELMNLVNAH